MVSRKAASKLSRLSYCLWSTTAVGMPSLAAICNPPASALLLMTAAIRAGHCSCRAARTMAAILLPPPEMRITMFFIARIVTRRASATKRICCDAAWGLALAACPRFQRRGRRAGTGSECQSPSGLLLERVKDPERHFLFSPEVGGIAKHIEQGLARLLVEFLRVRQLLQHDQKTGLGAGVMDGIGQAFTQGIKILAARFGKVEIFANAGAHLLFCLRIGAMGV